VFYNDSLILTRQRHLSPFTGNLFTMKANKTLIYLEASATMEWRVNGTSTPGSSEISVNNIRSMLRNKERWIPISSVQYIKALFKFYLAFTLLRGNIRTKTHFMHQKAYKLNSKALVFLTLDPIDRISSIYCVSFNCAYI